MCEGLRFILEEDPLDYHYRQGRQWPIMVKFTEILMPDLVLMDAVMAIMNGKEEERKKKKNFSAVRVILLSAHGEDKYVMQALAFCIDGFLLLRDTTSVILLKAIHEVVRGSIVF